MITVPDPTTSAPVNVFMAQHGDYIDAIVRAKDKATWEAIAVANHLLIQNADGSLSPNDGCTIDVIGPVVTVPAVLSADSLSTVTPATMDNRYHVNLRFRADVAWQPLALAWTDNGTADPSVDKAEVGHVLNDIALINPDTIRTPKRVWL